MLELPTVEGGLKIGDADGLGQIVVHAGGEAFSRSPCMALAVMAMMWMAGGIRGGCAERSRSRPARASGNP